MASSRDALGGAGSGEFDATYGHNLINPRKQYKFEGDISSKLIIGECRAPVYIRLGVLESDEHIIQTVAHEISEIEEARYAMKVLTSGRTFLDKTRPNIKGNWHYDAVTAGDQAVNAFRTRIK